MRSYITMVTQHRLSLFDQYTQSNEHQTRQDLRDVRKTILDRFQWVIVELERTIEHLQAERLSVVDAQRSLDRPMVKEVGRVSLRDCPIRSMMCS